MRACTRMLYATLASASSIVVASQAFSQTAQFTDAQRVAMSRYQAYYGLSTERFVGAPTLGRFTKTPDGNFNSTDSLLIGSSSGDGSGPGAGSPNGN